MSTGSTTPTPASMFVSTNPAPANNVLLTIHGDANVGNIPTLGVEELLEWRKNTTDSCFTVRYRIFPKQTSFDAKHFPHPGKVVDVDVFALLDCIDGYKTELARVVDREFDQMRDECETFQFNTCTYCAKLLGGAYTDCDYCRDYYAKRNRRGGIAVLPSMLSREELLGHSPTVAERLEAEVDELEDVRVKREYYKDMI